MKKDDYPLVESLDKKIISISRIAIRLHHKQNMESVKGFFYFADTTLLQITKFID